MHALLDDESRRRYPLAAFRKAYVDAAGTATATAVRVGDPRGSSGDSLRIPVVVATRIFREVRGAGRAARSASRAWRWSPELVFPGLRRGRAADPPHPGAAARGDRVGGQQGAGRGPGRGPARSPEGVGSSIAGTVEPSDDRAERERDLRPRLRRATRRSGAPGSSARSRPRSRAFPGGTLVAGRTVLARSRPRAAARVRSTIDSRLQEAAVEALAGRLGGIAALDPRTGEVRALAGDRLLGAPAAGFDVQDRDHRRRAGEEARSSSATGSRSRPRP